MYNNDKNTDLDSFGIVVLEALIGPSIYSSEFELSESDSLRKQVCIYFYPQTEPIFKNAKTSRTQ